MGVFFGKQDNTLRHENPGSEDITGEQSVGKSIRATLHLLILQNVILHFPGFHLNQPMLQYHSSLIWYIHGILSSGHDG
jgi:hypothetical protein